MPEDALTTGRLVLRRWREADAEAMVATYSREEVWRWLGASPAALLDVGEARERIARWSRLSDGWRGMWAVETPGVPGLEAPQPCGTVLLVTLPRSDGEPSDALEVGWHLHPAAWGHGIATEGARALLDRARSAGVREVHAVVRPGNDASSAVCARLGMTALGRTTRWYGVELDDHLLTL